MTRPQAAARLAPIFFTLAMLARPAAAAEPPVDFNRDVRPILSEACFTCHGPDTAKRKARLRLDTREGAFAPRDGGPAVIVPGKPEESELVARIVSDDPDERMPPPDTGHPLGKKQIELIRRWVAQGAEWKGHWAFIPPSRPNVPDVSKVEAPAGFVRNDVDRFILAKLTEKGLKPSPEADRATLARRLWLDLLGLPPSPAEVDAFAADTSPDAYEKLVDRLLTSPHHGERLASLWLDLVRYADTTGIHGDNHRDVALFRDYVIDSFNQNMPFDRFTVEQLAGDLLAKPTDTQRIASGYNKLLMTTTEGGAQAKEYIAKYAADRVRNASGVWLGATLGCAECHDHKFDPFTTRDFYRFAAFFADIQEAAVGLPEPVKVPTPAQAARVKALDAEVSRLQRVLDTPTPALLASQATWEAKRPAERGVEWDVLRPVKAASGRGATLTTLGDGSVFVSGENPDRDTYTMSFDAPRSKTLTAIRLEVMPDGRLPALGPGRSASGNFVLHEVTLADGEKRVAWSGATASHAQAGFPVAHSIDGKAETGWAILDEAGRPNVAVFEAGDDFGGGGVLTLTLRFNFGFQHTLGRFRVSATGASRPVRAGSIPTAVADALAKPPADRTGAEASSIAAYYRSIAPALQPVRDEIAVLKKAKSDVEAVMPATLVSRSGPPREMRILPRGNWLDESGPVVTPGVPRFLKTSRSSDDESSRATRLELARWVVARDNPLTARVFVNRLWAMTFGQGLVSTPEDFGAQGALPSHPELLDWLAVEFMDGGWDVRHILRLLVTSGAYRQTSNVSEELRHVDPYNQWLARQGRFRVDAETVRDIALSVSGLLSPRVGGPSARPYQPAGYWAHLNFPKREYQPDGGEGLYRRGLYTYWCRTFLHPSLLAFDAPTREECARRPRSNTPLQALVLLNDPSYVEAARALAERAIREGGRSTPERVAWISRTVLSRPPRPAEGPVLSDLVDKHLAQYRADRAAAEELIHAGARPVPDDLDPAELAAWTSAARVVLNLHETVTRN